LLSQTGPRNHIMPTTDSLLAPSTDTPNALPTFDRDQFGRYVTQPPSQNPTGQE
jgi:hypothetical protein